MNLRGMLYAAAGFGLSAVLFANSANHARQGVPDGISKVANSGILVTISIENEDVILRWTPAAPHPGSHYVYRIFRNDAADFAVDDVQPIAGVDGLSYRDQGVLSDHDICFYRVVPMEVVSPEPLFNPPYPGVTIEDFESGTAVLYSYDGEDFDPNEWEITGDYAYANSNYSLYLYGNTWKELRLDTSRVLTDQSVWQVAMRSHRRGEIQAFGLGDSARVFFYVTRGSQFVYEPEYNLTYQATLYDSIWTPYLFAVGSDWEAAFGDYPAITRLIFVNDNDAGQSHGNTFFDEILDVTGNLPQPPQVEIVAIQNPVSLSGPNFIGSGPEVNIGFIAHVSDPDNDLMTLRWDFGDGAASSELRPTHSFPRFPNITVSLTATDSLGLMGTDVVHIPVSPPNIYGDVTMSFVGDVMMARRYENPGGIIQTYGVNYIFHAIRDLLESVNIAVCNLECPLTDDGTHHPTKQIVFRGRPEYASALTYAGFEMATLANNHIWDYMDPGMIETMQVIDQQGIKRTGAGLDCILARQPAYITRNGIRVALLGFCNRTGRADNELPFLDAGMSKGGLAMLSYENLDATIPNVRETADRVFVFFHSGEEYTTGPDVDDVMDDDIGIDNVGNPLVFRTEPTDQEQELRQYAIDLGADMVINSHPHVLQGIEVYNGKVIAHSLGNFAFDQNYWETYPSALVKTNFDAGNAIDDVTIHPIYIDDYIPKPAVGSLGRNILERLMQYSRELNTTLVFADSGNDVAKVVIDSTGLQQELHDHSVTIAMRLESPGVYISEPLPLQDDGASPRQIISVISESGAVPCSLSLGRDILWVGGFENEGATSWDLNSSSEWYESEYIHSGGRSLGLSRESSNPVNVVSELEDRVPVSTNREYSLVGWIRTNNADRAAILAMWFDGRTSGNPVRRDTVSTPITGTAGWTYRWEHMSPPNNGHYVNIRCNLFPPDDGTGYAYFDDLALVEWEDWAGQLPYSIDYPSDLRYLRIFAQESVDSVTVNYQTIRQWLP
jgi:poly-gamma-glutamate capsule biosynthesis protein CapA/YwtB (metallophosphatase superfamily)